MHGEWTLPLRFAAAHDDTAAADLSELVRAHAATLFRIAHAVLRNRAEAEDCVQDAFVRALSHADDLHAIREPRAWLLRVTWNLAIDRRRRTRPEQAEDTFLNSLAESRVGAERMLEERARLAIVLAEIDRLPRREREALLLSAFDELTQDEIAATLAVSTSAVRALLFRARGRLRERLARKGVA